MHVCLLKTRESIEDLCMDCKSVPFLYIFAKIYYKFHTMILRLIVSMLLFFAMNSCSSKKGVHQNVEFTIKDKSINDNSVITLLIRNNTATNYYLPIINSFESERWKYMLSADESRFFFIYKIGYTNDNIQKYWGSSNCFGEEVIDEEMDHLQELWKQKKKTIEIKDLILLKSGERIEIKVPMNVHLKSTEDCLWELEGYNQKGLKIGLNYPAKSKDLADRFLSKETIDSLKKMGFELYEKEIDSNKVPLLLN